ncbi:metal-dependent hydrolase [Halobaculum magnesiiphilum]|uniref:Metal-dependent hydrolase n=1 Tax=Halobaculum magnesiiphilum TaxID=1017351 RepID=A0A8T8WIP9_9EURY|nr:metal-dependent hydrolase [Halobaculum magnesiiphilum]QZP39707.1 metal-dependent hydrolase [Halobaculum magnesiiphilum]
MWPWDHVAVAYLAYAVYARARGRRPSDAAALAVVAAAVAPDMIDKPLSWWLAVFPSGRSLGHSAFTAVGVVAITGAVQRRVGAVGFTPAVAIGYVSHLLGDMAYPLLVKDTLSVEFLLWPLVPAVNDPTPAPFTYVAELFAAYLGYLTTPAGATYLVLDLVFLLGTATLWIRDGAPGARWIREWTTDSDEE